MENKWYNLKKRNKIYLTYLVYLIFALYMISLIIKESSVIGKSMYFILFASLCLIVFLHEYLNFLYNKSINLLTNECDPVNGLEQIEKLEKLDIFKNYKQSILVFKLLAYSDLNLYDKTLELLDKTPIKYFNSAYDLLLIYHYNLFLSYIYLNDKSKVKENFKKCMELKNKGRGKTKILPILSWNEIEGIYYLYENDLKSARKSLYKVSSSNMNKREKYNYLMHLSLLEIKTENYQDAKIHLKEIIQYSNSMYIKTLAFELSKKHINRLGRIINET